MTLRVGLIGAGGNTKLRHIPGFRAIDDVEITAVCNRSLASSRAVADEYGIAGVEEDWHALINRDDVDAICIGTWPYTHAEMTIAALRQNKHVLTEARMALDVGEARAMLAAADASDAVAMVVPAPFYLAFEATLLDMLADGVFGDLLEIHVNALGGGYNPTAPLSWRQRRDRSGNNIMSMGIFNETVRRYAGHEASVMAYGKVFVAERDDPETADRGSVDILDSLGVLAEYESGATGCITSARSRDVAEAPRSSPTAPAAVFVSKAIRRSSASTAVSSNRSRSRPSGVVVGVSRKTSSTRFATVHRLRGRASPMG